MPLKHLSTNLTVNVVSFLFKTDLEPDTFKCGRCSQVFLQIDEFTNHKRRKSCKRKHEPASFFLNLVEKEGISNIFIYIIVMT